MARLPETNAGDREQVTGDSRNLRPQAICPRSQKTKNGKNQKQWQNTNHQRQAIGKLLPRSFFNRDPREVCPELLGKLIVRRQGRSLLAARVVEVEAYLGVDDLAAHAAAGRTARNSVLFGPPGHAYIYFIYGVHYCLNISCLPDGEAGCLLIRALEPIAGIEQMAQARGLADLDLHSSCNLRLLASGPGKLCEALGITRERDNGKDMVSARSDLQVMSDNYKVNKVAVTKRIGITKSADMPLRYVIAGNPFVSKNIMPLMQSGV